VHLRDRDAPVQPGLAPAVEELQGRLDAPLRLLAAGHSVAGIDRRPAKGMPKEVEHHQTDILKRTAEDVFRRFKPEVVVHMATVSHFTTRAGGDRFRINLGGTRAVFEHCAAHGVKHVVFVGRHTFYGAASDSPLYHSETEPPLALSTYPELADLVAADLFATQALWRYADLRTAVLRFVYTLGPSGHGTLATYLRGPRVPTVLGFDPLFQFLHDDDAAAAIALAVEKRIHGVFNVAGPAPVPLSVLIRETDRDSIAVPEAILHLLLGRFGLPKLPKGALSHLKHGVVIDPAIFKKETGFVPGHDEVATMRSYAEAFPVS